MSGPQRFVDIHCHLLPGLDDGPASWEETLAMAGMASADGVAAIVATPHQLGNHPGNSPRRIREQVAKLQVLLDERRIPLQVSAGADVRVEPDLPAKVRRDEVLTLADQGRHVLLELPHEVYLPLDRVLVELEDAGLVGVLSHPERNEGILRRPEIIRPLVAAGCLVQITAGSLTGFFGSRVQKLANWLILKGLVHCVATDAHGVRGRDPVLRPALRRVAALVGHSVAMELFLGNPARIVSGRDVTACPRSTGTMAWSGPPKGRKAG